VTIRETGEVTVVADGAVLGWFLAGEWVSDSDRVQLGGDEVYQIFDLEGAAGERQAGEIVRYCGDLGEEFDDQGVQFEPEVSGIAVWAPWTVEAGKLELASPTPEIIAAGEAVLADHGLGDTMPRFAQVFLTDLDHDGVEEVLAVLERNPGEFPAPGDHGLVILIEGGEDDARVAVLIEDVVTADQLSESPDTFDNWFLTATAFRVTAVADVNGDGLDEVHVAYGAYESWGSILYEWQPSSREFSAVLDSGCGL
jgi:hypothetical protein